MGADIEAKRQREKAIVNEMIALYCRKKHGTRGGLCPDCAALAAYAQQGGFCPNETEGECAQDAQIEYMI